MHLFAYNNQSESAKVLSSALGIRRIRHTGSTFKGGPSKKILNWGAASLPDELLKCEIINHPGAVRRCTNKRVFFETVNEKVSIPDWTTNKEEAFKWLAEGSRVVARTVLNGHSAEGLVIMTKDDMSSFVDAPLYTKYVPKKDEYRIHVINDEVVDVQRKAIRPGWIEEHNTKPNFLVRNLANGFIYVRENVSAPECALNEARKAVQAIGLNFGAVDAIYNEKRQEAFILEVNSAPGLQNTTLDIYASKIKEHFG